MLKGWAKLAGTLVAIALMPNHAIAITADLLIQPGNVIELNTPLPEPFKKPSVNPNSPAETDSTDSDDLNEESDAQTLHLEIQLSKRKVVLLQGKTTVKSYPIAVGRPGWETPKGKYKVIQKLKNPTWIHPLKKGVVIPGGDPENPLGRYWIGFWTDGKNWIGFHGTPNPGSVGRAASHGCIRMYNKDIEELFQQVDLGTPVNVVQ